MKNQIPRSLPATLAVLLFAWGLLRADTPPNVVLIFADDIGIETIRAYGGEYDTPHIDSLAENGVRFDQGHATPVCTTSRTRLMVGTYNFKHYKAFAHLDPDLYTLPHYLKDAGYQTLVSGKWQLSGNGIYGGPGTYPNEAGFDEYFVWQVDRFLKGSRYWQPTLSDNGKAKTYCEDDFAPTLINDYILDFIDRKQDQPFFVYYTPVLAHDPWTTTPDSLDAKTTQEKFHGMMTYLDKMVGRVLQKLEEHELIDNTLILFIGDNGTHPQIVSERHGKPIAGGKWHTKDSGTHVPFLMQWKNTLPKGAVRSELVEVMDVFPTIASAVSQSTPHALDGLNLIPYATGEIDHTRDWIFMHYDPQWGSDYFNSPMPAARFIFTTQWKLYGDNRFYHTARDPLEAHPLSPETLSGESLQSYRILKDQFDAMGDGPLKAPYINPPLQRPPVPEPDCDD